MESVDANNDHQGDRPTNLTKTPGQDLDPAYAPNGKRIAFQSNRDGNAEIYTMDTDPATDDAINRTNNDTAVEFEPSWQPLH
jgi:TolB protein